MQVLHTTLGAMTRDQLGMILPHEHVFVDLRTPDQPGYGQADAADVVALMAPQVERIKAQGVTALVECTPTGVGRRPDLDLAVSLATGFPIVVPTGSYREPWIEDQVRAMTDRQLEDWMVRELTEGFDDAPFRAGWIKLSAGDDGIAPNEAKILRAAARAAIRTGAVIGSHTIRGRVVMDQLDIIEEEGYRADRFISIHTQEEPDFALNLAVAERGAWIEYDHVGRSADEGVLSLVQRVLDAGLEKQLLLSHDLGWFDPAKPRGGTPRPWAHLGEVFLPLMRESGISDAVIHQLTHDNPFNAFARPIAE